MFLVNSDNKVRLQKLVIERLTTFVFQVPEGIIYCDGERATNLKTEASCGDYAFKQDEAVTVIFSVYAKIRAGNYAGAVIIDSEDTGVYVQAAFVSREIRGELLIKQKRRLISCHKMVRPGVADIIIPLHMLSLVVITPQAFMDMAKS